MNKHTMIRRLGILLCVFALATSLWGCADSITGPEVPQQQLQPMDTGDGITDENGDGHEPGWW